MSQRPLEPLRDDAPPVSLVLFCLTNKAFGTQGRIEARRLDADASTKRAVNAQPISVGAAFLTLMQP